jgi:hypothetical protein
MHEGNNGEKLPLADEARAREKWRGGETFIDKGQENVGLPASEVDNAASGGGGQAGSAADGRPGRAPGNIPPPD